MPDSEIARATAIAIGRITCIKTGAEIGLLYQWDNGETQAALFADGLTEIPSCVALHSKSNSRVKQD